MDHGGGTLDAAAKLVAEEFCVPLEKVGISPADTRSTGYDVCTHATRGVYCGAGAVLDVARDAKKVLFEYASRILDAPVDSLKTKLDKDAGESIIYVVGMDEINITISIVSLVGNIGKINVVIRDFVFKLKGLCEVTNYSQIKTEMVKPKKEEK